MFPDGNHAGTAYYELNLPDKETIFMFKQLSLRIHLFKNCF